ncbi:thioredoxin domain-containing protein 16 isoform X2 [Mixophyes fleayi]|uniref:thioredoxin domain-containing protein 16 isoform X2 n=1 Tax=Mixophyes fleayi TaxID=3061075 RepID=UPI003F4DE48E
MMICPGLFLLLLSVNGSFMVKAKNVLHELSTNSYSSALVPGRTSLLYFSSAGASNNVIFLEELQKSSGALEDYGIYVAKVNCIKEDMLKFCAEESAYLFRGNKLLREFPTDTLFDVNAIVANVLFVLLYNDVKYVTSILELQKLEDAMKGKKDVVFIYVQAIGTPEHRSVMEAAFVHGSTYQFVLTTETNLLKNISAEDHSLVPGKLVFSHCKSLTSVTQTCRRTALQPPLTTLNIHRFLKLMGAPLVVEASGDPDKFTSVHLQFGLPVVFILSQRETYEADMETAEEVAWQLLGRAGVATLLRDTCGVQIPLTSNVAIKRSEENTPVKYMTLEETQQILDLIDVTKDKSDKPEEKGGDPEVQDDEVAEAVYRHRKRSVDLQLIPQLTDDTFKMVLSSPRHTAVLFYMSWDHVSVTVLRSFVEMAERYKEILDVSLGRVNCADWTYVCTKENITIFPTVKLYQAELEPIVYTGMMGAEELAKFLMLIKLECPLQLLTVEDSEDYISGKMHKDLVAYHNLSILGIFTPTLKEADEFISAGKNLRGFAVVGIYIGEKTSVLAEKYGTLPPAVLFSRHDIQKVRAVSLQNAPAGEILPLLRREILGEFPEVTVDSLPSLLKRQEPLLILFSDARPNPSDEKHILSLERGKYLEQYLTCWLNLKNTPAGNLVLKKYFGIFPNLPVLVLITFDSLGQVFAFPTDQQITEVNILYWLEMIKAGEETPVYSLSKEDWTAPLPHYDFLAMMDEADPNFAAQKIRIRMKPARSMKAEFSPDVDGSKRHRTVTSLRGTVPKFLQSEEESEEHTEL